MNPQKTPKKKRHIVDAATGLFQRYGMKRVTVTEICQTAHVSKMTFYKYFPNKVELAKHVIDSLSDGALDELDRIQGLDVPFAEKAQLWIDNGVKLAKELGPTFFEEIYNVDEELEEFIDERRAKNHAHFVAFLADAQGRGQIRSDVTPDFILLVAERLNDLARDDRALAIYPSYVELTRATRSVFFSGILEDETKAPGISPPRGDVVPTS